MVAPDRQASTGLIRRRLTGADAAEFKALRLEAFERHRREFRSTPQDEAARSLSEINSVLERDFVVGLFIAGALVGVAGLTLLARAKLRHKAEFWGFYVRAEHRRAGAGTALLTAALDHAREQVEAVTLVVSSDNLAAVRLYQRWGFTPYGHESRAMKLGEGEYVDETLMVKRFEA